MTKNKCIYASYNERQCSYSRSLYALINQTVKFSLWIIFFPITRWQQILQKKNWIACNFRGSSIDIQQSVYVSWFESICILNYWLLIVTEDNEAGGIKGSLKHPCRNCWDVFESPGGLQPMLSLFLFEVLVDG